MQSETVMVGWARMMLAGIVRVGRDVDAAAAVQLKAELGWQ